MEVGAGLKQLTVAGLDPAGMPGTVVGWGRTEEGGQLPAVIQEVQVPILTLAECRASKYRASRITPNMMCAGKGTQDSCQVSEDWRPGPARQTRPQRQVLHKVDRLVPLQGDSGGPLIVGTGEDGRNQVVGKCIPDFPMDGGTLCGVPVHTQTRLVTCPPVSWFQGSFRGASAAAGPATRACTRALPATWTG